VSKTATHANVNQTLKCINITWIMMKSKSRIE